MSSSDDDGSRDLDDASSAARIAGICAAVLLALSIAGVAGTAVAIDQVAILSPARTAVEAAPGETIEIDVTLRSQGGHGGEGVDIVTLIARYHPDYLEITDVDRGPWLEGDGTTVTTADEIAHERGTAVLEQRREPTAGGTTGSGTVATLTVRVAEDAPAGTTTISFDESTVGLTGDWPIAVVAEDATVAIDGGTESLEPFDHPDPGEIERASTASSAGEDSSDSGSETTGTDGDDPVPGFTIGLGIVAVALVALRLAAARDGNH